MGLDGTKYVKHSLCLEHVSINYLNQVGAAEYRKLRWDGKTPLPKPIVLPEGINGTIPSRDAGREIPYRVFKPANGESKGIHLHIHGGGWVLQSEH